MSLALVAVSLTAMAGVGALAVDLGMMYKARAEALRAAEAGALAGASVFLDFTPSAATVEARARALAEANSVLNRQVKTSEVQVDPDMVAERVRVRVARSGIGTWFAWVFEDSMQVAATAAAGVTEASGANCVTPIMIPDAWADDTENPGTSWEDQIEQWSYGNGDSYGAFDRPGVQTGYGSDHRKLIFSDGYDNDFGRPITLRAQSPLTNGPDAYRLWVHKDEPPEIAERTGECDARSVSLGNGGDYEVAPLGEALPLGTLGARIADDPGTSWDNGQKKMQSGSYSDWRQSPRIIKVALFDPAQIPTMASGSPVQFNNIVLLFLENVDAVAGTVTGRLLYYSSGNDDDGDAGALVKHIKLVE